LFYQKLLTDKQTNKQTPIKHNLLIASDNYETIMQTRGNTK